MVRHGETELNRRKVLQGNMDSPLTAKGIEDAERVAKCLDSIDFRFAITSNLGRAIHTAEIILRGKNKRIIQTPNVAEMRFGNWQGKTQEEICVDEKAAENYFAYFQDPIRYRPENGAESFEEVIGRGAQFLEEMKKLSDKYPNEKILLVSHGAFIKAMLKSITGNPIERFWQDPFIPNLSVTILEIDRNGIRIIKEADQSYVGGKTIRIQDSGYIK